MAYNFTAANSRYLSTSSSPLASSPITITAMANRAATSGIFVIGTCGQFSGSHRVQLVIRSDGDFKPHLFSSGTLTSTASNSGAAPSSMNLNQWHHVAGVESANNNRVAYIDGQEGSTQTTDVGTQNTFDYINIGSRTVSGAAGTFFTGMIAEFGIWNVALTAAESASLAKGMTCDKIRPQSLVFYAPLVRDLIDAKGGLTITNNNGATVANHPRIY